MKKVVAFVCITAFLFATMEVALKLGGSELDSLQLTFLRFMIGGIILAPFAVRETKQLREEAEAAGQVRSKLGAKDIGWLALVGAMGVGISMVAFQYGVNACNAATASSLICLNPIFTMVIAHIFTSEKMDKLKGIAFVLGLIAIVFMVRPWDIQEGNSVIGIILMLVAAITFACYTVMGKRTIGRIGTFTQTSISFIIGSLFILVVMVATGRPVFENIVDNLALVLYVGVMVTGVGYFTYFSAIKYSDATTGSIAFFIKPVIAPIFAVVFLNESILWNTIVGVILLVTASFLTLYDSSHKNTDY